MLDASLFTKNERSEVHVTRTDFLPANHCNRSVLAQGFTEYLKSQRLHPYEIDEWKKAASQGMELSSEFKAKIILALSEGILKEDLVTVDEDALTGTCGQLIFRWIRSHFYGPDIIWCYPEILTESSKAKGIDYFEILVVSQLDFD